VGRSIKIKGIGGNTWGTKFHLLGLLSVGLGQSALNRGWGEETGRGNPKGRLTDIHTEDKTSGVRALDLRKMGQSVNATKLPK